MIDVQCGDLAVRLRPARPEDEGFVMKGWLVGFRDVGEWPKLLSSRRYFAAQKERATRLLALSTTTVACNPAREWQAFGFITHERAHVIHWIYVKETWRRQGVARALWEHAGKPRVATHWTLHAADIQQRAGLLYNPFILEQREAA